MYHSVPMEGSSVETVVRSRNWNIFALKFQRCIILVKSPVYCTFKLDIEDQEMTNQTVTL